MYQNENGEIFRATHARRGGADDLVFAFLLILITILLRPSGVMAYEDSLAYFNFYNNFAHPGPLFFYEGYVALCPQLIAFSISRLTFCTQMLAYVVVSLSFGMFFIYQLTQIIRSKIKLRLPAYAAASCFALVILLHKGLHTDGWNYFANLTYTIWFGLMGFFFRLVNLSLGKPFSPVWFIFCALSVLSHPLCICALPVLVLFCIRYWRRGPAFALECGAYICLMLLYVLFLVKHDRSALAREPLSLHGAWDTVANTARLAGAAMSHSAGLALAGLTMFLLLIVARFFWMTITRRTPRSALPDALLLPLIAYFGLAPSMIFILSSRLAEYHGFIEGRYVLPALYSTMLIVILFLADHRLPAAWLLAVSRIDLTRQAKLVAFAAGLAIVFVLPLTAVATGVPARLADFAAQYQFLDYAGILSRYRFLVSSADFRRSCASGAMVFEWDKWSTIVLCRPALTNVGSQPITTYTSPVTVWRERPLPNLPVHAHEDEPILYVGEAVFRQISVPSAQAVAR